MARNAHTLEAFLRHTAELSVEASWGALPLEHSDLGLTNPEELGLKFRCSESTILPPELHSLQHGWPGGQNESNQRNTGEEGPGRVAVGSWQPWWSTSQASEPRRALSSWRLPSWQRSLCLTSYGHWQSWALMSRALRPHANVCVKCVCPHYTYAWTLYWYRQT